MGNGAKVNGFLGLMTIKMPVNYYPLPISYYLLAVGFTIFQQALY